MLQNAYFLAKIGADTAENEQHFAEILPTGRRVADRCPPKGAPGRPALKAAPAASLRELVLGGSLLRHAACVGA